MYVEVINQKSIHIWPKCFCYLGSFSFLITPELWMISELLILVSDEYWLCKRPSSNQAWFLQARQVVLFVQILYLYCFKHHSHNYNFSKSKWKILSNLTIQATIDPNTHVYDAKNLYYTTQPLLTHHWFTDIIILSSDKQKIQLSKRGRLLLHISAYPDIYETLIGGGVEPAVFPVGGIRHIMANLSLGVMLWFTLKFWFIKRWISMVIWVIICGSISISLNAFLYSIYHKETVTIVLIKNKIIIWPAV